MKEKGHKRKDKESQSQVNQNFKQTDKRNFSGSAHSDVRVERDVEVKKTENREEWMSMTGMLKTFSKDDIKSQQKLTDKKHIDSYNPATSSRELNPYWKNGGSGIPQTSLMLKKSSEFLKPSNDDDYYSYKKNESKQKTIKKNDSIANKSYNWRTDSKEKKHYSEDISVSASEPSTSQKSDTQSQTKIKDNLYLSDEKLNKLGAKIVKAEIMGDMELVEELKAKLEAAREYRKNNINTGMIEEDNRVLLMTTSSSGSYRPLVNNTGNSQNKGGKRKAETYDADGRIKYFGNDDKYNLAQMFQEEKYGSNYDEDAELARSASKSKNPNDDLEDIFLDNISKNKNAAAENEKQKQRAIQQNMKLERSLDGCNYCFDSKNMLKHLIVSCGNRIYMALPSKQSLVEGHCILTTIQHSTCVTSVDEDVWEEIMNYRKLITQFFNSQDKDVVFYETAIKLNKFPHFIINCVPLPRNVGDMASIYFKKALLECEGEWAMNKKVVDLKGKNIRKGIPKGLPYFWVDFAMDPGFAHVIEDQHLFPKYFAEEIIGGMLDLDHTLWKNPQREFRDIQRKKVVEFLKDWKPFEECMKH